MSPFFVWLAAILSPFRGETRSWEDEIVYAIILEKFADGDASNNVMKERFHKHKERYEGGFWGGDLKGVTGKLDDLADLGITTILLYPVMQNDEAPIQKFLPTGYRPKDYERVDVNFGDVDALRRLVDEAHKRKIRVILDMPITLPGFEHPYLADPSKKDWFGPKSEYGVPRWKVENPEVADYIIGICTRWKERSGCDGFRLDSAHLQPVAFWKRFVTEVKAAPPKGDFVILSEATLNPREIGKFLSEGGFDGGYDFSAMRVRDVFGRDEDVGQLSFIASEAEQFYPAPRTMMAPIDNYEKAFATFANEPKKPRTLLALTYILTLDRVPLLYAGNENGTAFHKVGGAFPEDRETSKFSQNVKSLIALRKREPTLRRGDFHEVFSGDSVYAFERTLGQDRILVILNGKDEKARFTAKIGDRHWNDCRLEDVFTGEIVKKSSDASPIEVEPFGSRILRVTGR